LEEREKRLRTIVVICLLSACFFASRILAQDAPVTEAAAVMAPGPSAEVTIRVVNFNDIGAISLTMEYDAAVALANTIEPNPLLGGSFIYNTATPGSLTVSWIGTSGINLADSSVLLTITFSEVATGITSLDWYDNGTSCEYAKFDGGAYNVLNDTPTEDFYLSGQLIFQGESPVSVLSDQIACAGDDIEVPVTVTGFTNIGAISLRIHYNPAVLEFQEFTPNDALPANFIVAAEVPGTIIASGYVSGSGMGITLPDGSVLFSMLFSYQGGYTDLTWYDNGTSCEYATAPPPDFIPCYDQPQETYYIDASIHDYPLDIILQKNPNCGTFTVKLYPFCNMNNTLTKIIFTVKWPATTGSDVQPEDVVGIWPGLEQQGSRVLYEGNYYVTFSSTTSYSVNWTANTENIIMNFNHSGTGEGTTDFTIIASDYNTIEPGLHTAYYVEVASIDHTGEITNNANDTYLNCALYMKDFLQGAYDPETNLLRTDIKDNGYLPTTQPYLNTPLGYNGTESVVSFTVPVVDWIVIELRSGTGPETKIIRQAALLLDQGTIVGKDQVNPPVFHEIIPENQYYVVLYHRNHIPVMSAESITLPNTPVNKHDFTSNPSTNVYGSTNGVILLETNVYGQIAGDVNMDNRLIYSGPNNDRGLIFAKINEVSSPPVYLTTTIQGYYAEDLNMNGVVKYSGPNNDQGIIFVNIGYYIDPAYLISVYNGVVPVNFPLTMNDYPYDNFQNVWYNSYATTTSNICIPNEYKYVLINTISPK
jgi:hypothetical protein